MKKWFLIGFIVALVIFVLSSKQINFHDTAEYITIAKSLAGLSSINVYLVHPIFYPLVIAGWLKISGTLVMVKLVNILLLIAIAHILYDRNLKAFWLWIFSPLVWFVAPQVTPIIPVSFCVMGAYLTFKDWENDKKIKTLMISAFLFGLAFCFYTPIIPLIVFFIICFFYNKRVKHLLLYLITILLTSLISFFIDLYYFGVPYYTHLRNIAAHLMITSLSNPIAREIGGLSPYWYGGFNVWNMVLVFVVVAPLGLIFLKVNLWRWFKEIVFLLLCFIFYFFIGGAMIKYLLIFSPIFLIMIGPEFAKDKLVFNSLLSIGVIILLTMPFFNINYDTMTLNDMRNITSRYGTKFIIEDDLGIDAIYWEKDLTIISLSEYDQEPSKIKNFNSYTFNPVTPRLPLKQIPTIEIRNNKNGVVIEGFKYLITPQKEVEGFKLVERYEYLNLFEEGK